jgi:hypothetical protein
LIETAEARTEARQVAAALSGARRVTAIAALLPGSNAGL